ncbi:unnamed protein product [Rodentolepis nana]|uniref:Pecanex-like protein n=1 Tax=Rodentolepis nana TaxID=102285 RepID=A0A0R3TR22_RODNA|nr:unnamed protein product [Rodentolepis nana]
MMGFNLSNDLDGFGSSIHSAIELLKEGKFKFFKDEVGRSISKQCTTDVEGVDEEASSSSAMSLNVANSPAQAGDRHIRSPHGVTKQRLNSVSSGASISSSIRGRLAGVSGDVGEEVNQSSTTSTEAARRPQRVSVAGRGTPKLSSSSTAAVVNQETAEKRKDVGNTEMLSGNLTSTGQELINAPNMC